MRAYILTVVSAAILVSVLRSLTKEPLVRLVTGVFMALTVASPLVKLELPDVGAWMAAISADGEDAAAEGQQMAKEAERAIIKARVEAYILDKAAGYDAPLAVEVTVGEDAMPVSVTLTGPVSPYAKARLAQMMAQELGLGEEAQTWIQ